MNRFPDGARVCFIGDSITHSNMHLAHIVAYYREHFGDAKVEFYNCGISGGILGTTLGFFDEDVALYNPTHAVIMIGINDAARWALTFEGESKYQTIKDAFESYKANLSTLCQKLENMGVQITLCTPTPYAEYIQSDEPVLRGGYALMLGYAEYIKAFAEENGYPVCDYHSYITRIIQTETIYNPDRVHPNNRGQYYMAKCFLEHQGLEIGEEKPLPADVQAWHETVGKIRHIYATEYNVIRVLSGYKQDCYNLSNDERAAKIKEYLETEQNDPYVDSFKQLCQKYPEFKAQQQENIQFVIDFMKNQ